MEEKPRLNMHSERLQNGLGALEKHFGGCCGLVLENVV